MPRVISCLILYLASFPCFINMNAINSHLVVSSFLNPLANRSDLNTVAIGRLEAKFVDILARELNFTYEVHPPKDLLGSGYLDNVSWTGTMGQLQRKEVDVCVTAGQISHEKYQVVDYSYYIRSDELVIVMPYPNNTSKARAIFAAFSNEVWIGLSISYTVLTLGLWFFSRISDIPTREKLGDWFIYFMSAITKQGYFTTENSHAFRIICSTLCLTAVVIMNVYIARYTSDLTVKHYSFLVNSIEDAATKTYVMVHISKGTAAENFIMNIQSSNLQPIKQQILANPQLRHKLQDLNNLANIVKGNHIFLMPRTAALSRLEEDYQRTKQCRFALARKTFNSAHYAMTFPKGSPLTAKMNKEIMRMHETGILSYAERRSYAPHDPCSIRKTDTKEKKQSLKLMDLSGAFYVLFVGIAVSFGGFFYDVISYRWSQERRRRRACTQSMVVMPAKLSMNLIELKQSTSDLRSISAKNVPMQSTPNPQLTVEVLIESLTHSTRIRIESASTNSD